MRLLRFRLRIRTLLCLVALVALVLIGLRVYDDGPEAHWLLLKLRYGNVEARRSAANQAWRLDVSGMFQTVIAPVVMGPGDPERLEASRRLQKRRAELLFPVLIQTIKDADPICRGNALKALSVSALLNASDSNKGLVLRQILAATRDHDASVRASAVGSLASLAGQDMAGVIDAIRSALADSSVEVRQAAAWELGSIGVMVPESQPVVASILIPLLASREDARVRVKAAWGLCYFGGDDRRHPAGAGPDVVPALVSALRDRDVEVRRAIATIFGLSNPWDRRKDLIIPSLEAATREEDKVVRDNSALALFEMGQRDPAFIDLIQQAAVEPNRRDSFRFASALRKWTEEREATARAEASPGR